MGTPDPFLVLGVSGTHVEKAIIKEYIMQSDQTLTVCNYCVEVISRCLQVFWQKENFNEVLDLGVLKLTNK